MPLLFRTSPPGIFLHRHVGIEEAGPDEIVAAAVSRQPGRGKRKSCSIEILADQLVPREVLRIKPAVAHHAPVAPQEQILYEARNATDPDWSREKQCGNMMQSTIVTLYFLGLQETQVGSPHGLGRHLISTAFT
jgi:hypothetical protein